MIFILIRNYWAVSGSYLGTNRVFHGFFVKLPFEVLTLRVLYRIRENVQLIAASSPGLVPGKLNYITAF